MRDNIIIFATLIAGGLTKGGRLKTEKETTKGYALILGGTRGLGREIALALQQREQPTIVLGRSVEKVVLRGQQVQIRCDFEQPDSVSGAIRILEIGKYDIRDFYWVAGTLNKKPFHELKSDELLRELDVNFRNPLPLVQFAWKALQKDASHPVKIFCVVSSRSGLIARENEALYCASKFTQIGFTRSLAQESKNPLVDIWLILPGGMKTEGFWEGQKPADFDKFLEPAKVAAHILASIYVAYGENAETRVYTNIHELEIQRGSL